MFTINVKRRTLLVAILLASLILSGCIGGKSIVSDQSFDVQVVVIDQDGGPVEGASVVYNDTTEYTDVEGKSSLSLNAASQIEVAKAGFLFPESSISVSAEQEVTFIGYETAAILAALNSAETSEQLADILAYPIFTGVITELMAQYLAQIEIEGSFASIEDVNEQLIQEVNQTGALAAIQGLVGNDPDPDLLLELLLLLVEATPDLSELEIYSEAKEYYASQVNLADASFSALEFGDLIESINEVDPTVSIVSVEHDGVLNTGDPITFTVQAKNSNGDDVVWFNKMVTGVIDLFGPGLYFYSDFVFENGIAAVSIEIKEARSYELARVFVPKVLGEQEIEFSFTVIPGDMAALRITTSDAHYYPENVPLPYHGQELLLEVTDGYNVLEDYNETHMATVSVEILEIRGFPLLAAKGSQARPVIDGRVLLEFNDGAAEFDIEELMMEQFSEFSFDEVATVAVTVTIADLELSITKEMLLFWGR